MQQAVTYPHRLWFNKIGQLKYISHLDLNRCFSRAFKRANLPIWYTEGFNPHPFITFALPLPLGVEGLGEIMDVKLTALVPTGEIVKALNPVLPKGLEIVGAVQLLQKPAALSSASYFFNVNNIDLNTAETMKEIFSRDTLPTTKKSKSGEKAINLWDYIDCLEKSYSEDSQCFRLRADVPAGTREGINPNVILAFLEQALGRTLSCSIKRINPEFLDEE